MFSDTKEISQVRAITRMTKIKIQNGEKLCTRLQLKSYTKFPQNQVRSNDVYAISWNNQPRSRNVTEPTNLIIIRHGLVFPTKGLMGSRHGKSLPVSSPQFQEVLISFQSYPTESTKIGRVHSLEKIAYQFRETQGFERNCIKMRATSREKGKLVMTRSVEDIVFSTEMAALDFEPSRAEETFLQLIGLDRFITKVTWEILNVQVIQEVIANLDTDTMETKLNGKVIPIFGKGWKQKMKGVFYLQSFAAKREPGTPRGEGNRFVSQHQRQNEEQAR